MLKALPTDDEISGAGCQHAGQYLDRLMDDDSEAYEELLLQRNTDFGSEPDYQPIHRCVAHLIELMLYRIERLTGGDGADSNLAITEKDARKWCHIAGLESRRQ